MTSKQHLLPVVLPVLSSRLERVLRTPAQKTHEKPRLFCSRGFFYWLIESQRRFGLKRVRRETCCDELECANGFDEEEHGPVQFSTVAGASQSDEVGMMQTLLFDRRLVHGALIFFACAAPLRAQGNGLIRDVQLSNSGTLQGLVIPVSGSPAPGSMVQIRFQGKTVAVAKTATDGRFAIGRVRPGVHEVVTASGQTPVRIWANGTAPAGCQSQLTLPAQQNFVSMNQPMSGMCGEGCATQPCQSCAPASGLCLVDAISLATVGSSIAALVIAIDANRTADAASNAAAAAGAGAVAANVGAGNVVNAADANGGVASP